MDKKTLESMRAQFEDAQKQAMAQANFLAGRIATLDDLLSILDDEMRPEDAPDIEAEADE